MTKLEQLIKKLCPNGVEYKKLGDIATDVFRGAGITREQVTETGTPCVRYGEIYTTYGLYFDTCVSHTDENSIVSKKYFEHGDILFAITGESVEDIAKSTAYIGEEKCLAGGDIVVLKHNQNPKYLSYVLSTTEVQMQKSKGKVKSKVVHSSVPAIKDIVIPVPPLEVQCEIVRILDNFTELTAELTARKKQYEYYRDMLLIPDTKSEVEWHTLGEICQFKYGKGNNIPQETGIYPVYGCNGIVGTTNAYNSENAPIIGHIGSAGFVCWGSGKHFVTYNGTICVVNPDTIISKYAYYILKSLHLERLVKGSQPFLSYSDFASIKIPLPPLEKQARIVNILDRFDKLCNDISEGLPAEIEARRKQYEYYRDKLLSFKEEF